MTTYNDTPNPSSSFKSANILEFPARCEQCHKPLKSCKCDVWVGLCTGCGSHVYGGDNHRISTVDGIHDITCPECLVEESSWRAAEVVVRKAA